MVVRKGKVTEIFGWGPYLRKTWEETFCSHLLAEEKQEIYLDHFLWHLFSWKKAECFTGDAAIKAFHLAPTEKFTVFYQFIDEAYLIENADGFRVEDLPYEQDHMYYGDLYVMDWFGRWTFVLTHEPACGPYFFPGMND